ANRGKQRWRPRLRLQRQRGRREVPAPTLHRSQDWLHRDARKPVLQSSGHQQNSEELGHLKLSRQPLYLPMSMHWLSYATFSQCSGGFRTPFHCITGKHIGFVFRRPSLRSVSIYFQLGLEDFDRLVVQHKDQSRGTMAETLTSSQVKELTTHYTYGTWR